MIICDYKYVDADEFAAYAGSEYSAILDAYGSSDVVERKLHDCEGRMLAFILPNTPRADVPTQIDAFCRAVYSQMLFECTAYKSIAAAPPGTKEFKIGNFSMKFDDASSAFTVLKKGNIDPAAYSHLLREGLLYRGVERTVNDGVY